MSDVIRRCELKRQHNTILHAGRRKARDNTPTRLDKLASEVERLHNSAKMFHTVRETTRKPVTRLTIHDATGRVICDAAELNMWVTEHFSRQFSDPAVEELSAFVGRPPRLADPITTDEVKRAIGKLNSGRASGHDDLPVELLKCTAGLLAHMIASIFSDALDNNELLDLGKGVLILIQEPGKLIGPLTISF